MDIYDVIRTRRSVRAYRPDPIPEEVLTRVLDAARVAPSAGNRQPTRLILVAEPEARQKLAEMCGDQGFIGEAPIVVVACGRGANLRSPAAKPHYKTIVDATLVLDHLTLAARAEGLGTCWIGVLGEKANEKVMDFLGVPEDTEVVGITPLGYPKDDAFKEPGSRISREEFVRWERWGWDG